MAQPTIPSIGKPVHPASIKGPNATIWSASDEPGAALDEDFQAGTIVDTQGATALACTIKYDAAAATGNSCDLFFLVSNAATQPAIGDDEWAVLPGEDASPTEAVQDDSMPSGVDVTVTPEWGMIETRPGFFRVQADDAATDKARVALVVNVRYWRWIVVLAKEHGNTTTDGTLVIDAALIVG